MKDVLNQYLVYNKIKWDINEVLLIIMKNHSGDEKLIFLSEF